MLLTSITSEDIALIVIFSIMFLIIVMILIFLFVAMAKQNKFLYASAMDHYKDVIKYGNSVIKLTIGSINKTYFYANMLEAYVALNMPKELYDTASLITLPNYFEIKEFWLSIYELKSGNLEAAKTHFDLVMRRFTNDENIFAQPEVKTSLIILLEGYYAYCHGDIEKAKTITEKLTLLSVGSLLGRNILLEIRKK